MSSSLRLFVAIFLPLEIQKSIELFQKNLQAAIPVNSISWVLPQNLHLTLQFLGKMEPSRLPALSSTLDSLAEDTNPFEVHIQGFGMFPKKARCRVLWVGCLDPSHTLLPVVEKLRHTLEPLGFPNRTQEWLPHITIGRIKSSQALRPYSSRFETFQNKIFGKFVVHQIHLVESWLHPQGPIYSIRSSHDLREKTRVPLVDF